MEEKLLFTKIKINIKTTQYGYRAYIEGRLLEHNELLKIFDSPPIKDESIEKWSERVFGEQKFGLIINSGEKFNLELSKKIALKVKPLLDKVGFPREGINFTLFIGNYDNTPLGIHKDSPGENVIHFHLGPAGKTMYTWDKDEYEKLVGEMKSNNKDVDKYIPYATEFSFEEGDLYFMPQGEYHVGKNKGLSIALTFWFYNHSKERFANKLNDIVINQFLETSKDLLAPDRGSLDDTSGVDSTLDLFDIPEHLSNLSIKELMTEAYRDLRYSIHSNAGYRTNPFEKEEDIIFNVNDYIIVENPYKILYKNTSNNEKMDIFVRGVKFELTNFECVKKMIDEINKGVKVKILDLFKILDDEWEEDIKQYILGMIYKHHGIIII